MIGLNEAQKPLVVELIQSVLIYRMSKLLQDATGIKDGYKRAIELSQMLDLNLEMD